MIRLKSIQSKALVVSICATLLIVLIFASAIVPTQKDTLMRNLQSQAKNLVAALEQTTLSALSTDDMATVVEHCLAIVSSRNEIKYIGIAKPTGSAYYFFDERWTNTTVDTKLLLPADAVSAGKIAYNKELEEETYHYVARLEYAGIDLGFVTVGLQLNSYDEELDRMYFSTALIGVCVLLIGCMGSTFAARRFTNPIIALQEFTQQAVATGFCGRRVAIRTGDEIENLAIAFNNMAESVERTQHDLMVVHTNLERRVEERTQDLSQANNQLLLLFEMFRHCREGICITDAHGKIRKSNPAYSRMVGVEVDRLIGIDPIKQLLTGHDKVFSRVCSAWERIWQKAAWEGELADLCHTPSAVPLHVSSSAIYGSDGNITHYVLLFRDIAELKEQERVIQTQANNDALTGLPNRKFINDYIQSLLLSHKEENGVIALLFIDVDNFKYINDTYGHSAGDEMLKHVGNRLKKQLRPQDMIGRIGGDEFILVFSGVENRTLVQQILNRLINSFAEDFKLSESATIKASVSCGVAIYPDDGRTSDELLAYSDMAMYKAKSLGKNQAAFYDSEMHDEIRKTYALEQDLKHALINDHLVMYYQPIIDAESLQVAKVEALVRWIKPDGSMVPPDLFIPLAEKTNLINDLTSSVITKVFSQLQIWKDMGWEGTVSINLSAHCLRRADIVNYISLLARRYSIDLHDVELEVTETSIMGNMKSVQTTFNAFHSAGLSIALDDFGTGYSSLQYLADLPFQTLKIDKSFVSKMLSEKNSLVIVETIMSLAQSLNCKLVAEGVETATQASLLKKMGCHYLQGYHFSKPLPFEEITDFFFTSQDY